MRRFARVGLALLAGLIAGVATSQLIGPAPQGPPDRATCRPSEPARYLDAHDGPPLLLFGNSLLFDHNWQVPGIQVINCARQGLTLGAGLGLVADLPDITPKAILLGFGSVELLRGQSSPEAFSAALQDMFGALDARFPDTPALLLSIPESGPEYTQAPALNTVLRAAVASSPRRALIDLGALPIPPDAQLYDQIHLKAPVYIHVQDILRTHLHRR